VHADSAGEGEGSTFTVQLPLTRPADANGDDGKAQAPEKHTARAPAAEQAEMPDLFGVRVLIVDDEPDAREVVGTMLRRCGAEITVAASTREGLDVLARERPDVLISDIAMPDEDGYALIRQLRGFTPEEGGTTPAIALTAYAREEDRHLALNAGFQIHLVKPVEPIELASAVAALAPDPSLRKPPAHLGLA
jgi:CheY-like chemotaxis protein